MKTLQAGPLKYLLLDTNEVLRNAERSKPGTAVAVVATVEDGQPVFHPGFDVLAEGPVRLAYSQRDPLFKGRISVAGKEESFRALYATEGAVLIAESRDEKLAFPKAAAPKPSTKKAD